MSPSFPDLLIAFAEAVNALKIKLSSDESATTTYNGEIIKSIVGDVEARYSALKSLFYANGGAALVGTDSGITVQEKFNELVFDLNEIKSISGAVLIGTSGGSNVQAELDSLTANQQSGVIVFQTYALLDAYTPENSTEEKGSFKVVNDPEPSLNGYYSWVSDTTYTKNADLVANAISETNTSEAVSGAAVFDFKMNAYKKDMVSISNASYGEYFEYFPINEQTFVNLTDSATPVFTATKVASGLSIALSTGSRSFLFSTSNKVGNGLTRIVHTATVSAGTSPSLGLAFSDGSDTTAFYVQYNGWLVAQSTISGEDGILSTSIPTFSTGAVIETEYLINSNEKTATIKLSINGSVTYTFKVGNLPIGDVWIAMKNASTVIHSLDLSYVGDYQNDNIKANAGALSELSKSHVDAMAGLLASMQRKTPNGFTPEIPINYTFYVNASIYFSSVNLEPVLSENDPEVSIIYVDIETGSDSNDGTESSPLKSIGTAISTGKNGGKLLVKIKGGLYSYDHAWTASTADVDVLQVMSWDGEPVISSLHDDSLVWALYSGTTYSATFSKGVVNVFDASNLTPDGDYGILTLAASLADCEVTPSSYFLSGTTIYVNLFDNRPPDADVRVYKSDTYIAVNGHHKRSGSVCYLDNIHFEGGLTASFHTNFSSETEKSYLYARDCTFKYSAADNLDVDGWAFCVLQRSIAAWGGDDGFNYHANTLPTTPSCEVIEIDCIGRYNGLDAEGTNNGSTMHDGGWIIRVNGDYHHNQDRNVHDISDSFSWNLNCSASDSQTGNANFAAGVGGEDVTKMWLDNCVSSGSDADIEAYGSGVNVYTSNFTGDSVNTGSGTVAAYTP